MGKKKTDYRKWCCKLRRQIAELKETKAILMEELDTERCRVGQLKVQVQMYADSTTEYYSLLAKKDEQLGKTIGMMEDWAMRHWKRLKKEGAQ